MENGEKRLSFREDPFAIKQKGSKLSIEIISGIVLFLAGCYIMPTNAGILADAGMNEAGVYASTALLGAIATFLFGLIANAPILVAAGMGLNAFFAYTVCLGMGFSWQEGMMIVLLSSLLYFVLSITPARMAILKAFPSDLKKIISSGLGAFIAFVGLQGSGLIVSSDSTIVALGNLGDASTLLALFGILLAIGLMFAKTKKGLLSTFAVPIAMLCTAIIGVILVACGVADDGLPHADFSTGWGINGLEEVFLFGIFGSEGLDFGSVCANVFSNPLTYVAVFSLTFANMFNAAATIMALGGDFKLLDEKGDLLSNRPLIADSIGGLFAAPLGCCNTTTFGESAIAAKTGGKTGLAAFVTALLFLLSSFIYPVFSIFSYGCVTSCALVAIGGLIFSSNLREIDWKKPEVGFAAFICLLMIILTYSLSYGIGFALIVYLLILLVQGRGKEASWMLYLVGVLYLGSFALEAII